jgi:antitoxin (DNA-binding transcriptional repressor) of toxin-antitoxin stability system
MTTVTAHVAKTQLSKLIALVEAGEEVVILRGREPVVKLVPVNQERPARRFGWLRDQIDVPDSFFDPLPDDELDAWEH